MRIIAGVTALVLLSAAPAPAQEWIDFVSRDDGFHVNFPAQPKVTTTTYTSEYGAMLPAHVYAVTRDQERYSVTVVDYRGIEKQLTEKSKQCPPFADERCTGGEFGAAVGSGTGRPTSAARLCGPRGSSCSATQRSPTTCGTSSISSRATSCS
jgi:hypothetical protein